MKKLLILPFLFACFFCFSQEGNKEGRKTVSGSYQFWNQVYFQNIPYSSSAANVHLAIDTNTASDTYGMLVRKTAGAAGYTTLSQFVGETNWRSFYSDGSGDIQALAFGSSGKVLTSNGTSSAPSWETPTAPDLQSVTTVGSSSSVSIELTGEDVGDGHGLRITQGNTPLMINNTQDPGVLDVINGIMLIRSNTAGNGVSGQGITIAFVNEDNAGSQFGTGTIEHILTDATAASLNTEYNIRGTNNASSYNEIFMNIQTGGIVRVNDLADTLATKAYARSAGIGGSGETNTGSNLGGGLDNYSTKVGVDLRFNTFAAADFDLASNLITIDATKWLTITAAASAYQPLDGDLTYLAGFTPTANVKTILNAADYAAIKTALTLTVGTNVQAWDTDLDTWAGVTPGAGVATFLATPSSSNLKTAVTDETGSGALVFGTSPTLTTPRFANGGYIADANGEELIVFNTTASAVNYIKIENSAAGTSPNIYADGETNVNLGFSAKGTGAYLFYGNSSQSSALKLFEDTDNGSDIATITIPQSLSAARTYTFPDAATFVPIMSQTLTFTGPSTARTITFPDANFTAARTDAANTFTGASTTTSWVNNTPTIGTSGVSGSSHITSVGSVPTVSQTGAGTGGSVGIAFETGSTDAAGVITITTGNASVGSTGTITLTFNSAYTGNQPSIVLTLVKGATDWGALATIRVTTQSLSAPIFTWNNSATGAAVALTSNTTYKVAYMVIQK